MLTAIMTLTVLCMLTMTVGIAYGLIDWDGIKHAKLKKEREKNKPKK